MYVTSSGRSFSQDDPIWQPCDWLETTATATSDLHITRQTSRMYFRHHHAMYSTQQWTHSDSLAVTQTQYLRCHCLGPPIWPIFSCSQRLFPTNYRLPRCLTSGSKKITNVSHQLIALIIGFDRNRQLRVTRSWSSSDGISQNIFFLTPRSTFTCDETAGCIRAFDNDDVRL